MFWTYRSLKKVGVGELWGEGARRVVLAHGLEALSNLPLKYIRHIYIAKVACSADEIWPTQQVTQHHENKYSHGRRHVLIGT